MRHWPVAFALLALLGAACRPQLVTIRPGCEFRVMDAETGLPIPDAKITVVTLYAAKDTIGRWSFRTDDQGFAGMATIREARRREALAGRKPGNYQFVAGLQAKGYQYYSLSVTSGRVVVRLTRGFPVACL
jgi:hypothetical protein